MDLTSVFFYFDYQEKKDFKKYKKVSMEREFRKGREVQRINFDPS